MGSSPGGSRGTCKGCGAAIVWLRTRLGKTIPVNAGNVLDTDAIFDHARHTAHFATCPQANTFRRRYGQPK